MGRSDQRGRITSLLQLNSLALGAIDEYVESASSMIILELATSHIETRIVFQPLVIQGSDALAQLEHFERSEASHDDSDWTQ